MSKQQRPADLGDRSDPGPTRTPRHTAATPARSTFNSIGVRALDQRQDFDPTAQSPRWVRVSPTVGHAVEHSTSASGPQCPRRTPIGASPVADEVGRYKGLQAEPATRVDIDGQHGQRTASAMVKGEGLAILRRGHSRDHGSHAILRRAVGVHVRRQLARQPRR